MASGPARDTLAKIHRPSNRYPFHIFGLGQGWRIFLRARTDIADNYIFPITAVIASLNGIADFHDGCAAFRFWRWLQW